MASQLEREDQEGSMDSRETIVLSDYIFEVRINAVLRMGTLKTKLRDV